MAWRLVAGLSRRRFGFDSRSVHVKFVVDTVALGQVFLRVLRYSSVSIILPIFNNSSVSIILPIFNIQLHLHVALPKGQTGEACELPPPPPPNNTLSEIGEGCIRRQFHFTVFKGLIHGSPTRGPRAVCVNLSIYNYYTII
jgi:hypothetical protein